VVDQAAAVGATTIHGISFRIDDPAKVEARARELAVVNARAKADALARSAGVAITGVAAIAEGGGGMMPPVPMRAFSLAKAEDASTPVEAGATEVSVHVTVSYLIG
jgi:uncharacterized protein YggE